MTGLLCPSNFHSFLITGWSQTVIKMCRLLNMPTRDRTHTHTCRNMSTRVFTWTKQSNCLPRRPNCEDASCLIVKTTGRENLHIYSNILFPPTDTPSRWLFYLFNLSSILWIKGDHFNPSNEAISACSNIADAALFIFPASLIIFLAGDEACGSSHGGQ